MLIGKIAWGLMLIMQIVIRYPYRDSTKGDKPDTQEKVLLAFLSLGGILPLIYCFTNWLSFADYDAPIPVIVLGMVFAALGLWLFWRSHTDLGRNWSSTLAIHEEHELVTQGVYQRIRHPMYSANWLMMIGQALLLSNWIAGLSGLIAFAFMYFLRVDKEEQMMLESFGEQYQDYMSNTGRIIPKL